MAAEHVGAEAATSSAAAAAAGDEPMQQPPIHRRRSASEASWMLPPEFGGTTTSSSSSGPSRHRAWTSAAPAAAAAAPAQRGGDAYPKTVKDPKLVDKPSRFAGDPSVWRSWNFKLQNWLSTLDVRFPEWLTEVRSLTHPAKPVNEMAQSSAALYVILASLTEGEMLQIVEMTSGRKGFEAYRQMSWECEPRLAARKLSSLGKLLTPDFGSVADSRQFWARMLSW